jgi:uncharacterized protein (DUF1800 family)
MKLNQRVAVSLATFMLLVSFPSWAHAQSAGKPVELTGDARILHALNRMTFGPTPGQVATVRQIGLDAWIVQQLHPGTIDDSALDQRLLSYPALHMSVPELLQQVPPPPVIRAIIAGRMQMPQDPKLQAVYQTQVALIEARQQAQALRQMQSDNASGAAPAAKPSGSTDAGAAARAKIVADLKATSTVNLPPQQRIAAIIAMQPLQRVAFFRSLTPEERIALVAGLTPEQAQWMAAMQHPLAAIAAQLDAAKMLRATQSQRQLLQVMTDFWFNHFNVDIHKNALMPYYLTEYERDVIAPHALGKFEDLLGATARSRAMLLYLDNARSVGPNSAAAIRAGQRANGRPAPGLNENYGRELMELHTLGVNGGYTQADVIEVAKAFTGWTIDHPLQGGGFVFNAQRHEPGARVVLGQRIPAGGESQGLAVLHLLAESPATAHHISEELAERFVSDHPSPALVDRMANTYMKSHGDIRRVLQTMFASPEFWETANAGDKFKTPLEFVASAARASQTDAVRPVVLAAATARLGMPLYACQPPTGYSMQSSAWISAGGLVERMSYSVAFAQNRLPGLVNDWPALLGPDGPGMTPTEQQTRLEAVLLHGEASQATRAAVLHEMANWPAPISGVEPFQLRIGPAQGYVAPAAPAPPKAEHNSRLGMIAGLLLGSPDFQTR